MSPLVSLGTRGGIGRLHRWALGMSACLLAVISTMPTHADPFFVTVYGRTYKVDPRYPSNEPQGPKPQEAMKALPSDLARSPGFKPSHTQVLAEVEERIWIVHRKLEDELEKTTASSKGWSTEGGKASMPEITGSLASGVEQSRSPELQQLYDRHRALNLLARELRRSMDLPGKPPETGFSRPKLTPEIEADYRAQNFDPLEAYYGFRRVKAAFRSGDVELLADVTHYPLTVTGRSRRTIRNRDQFIAAEKVVMDPRARNIVAQSTFETLFVRDKGMMLGDGEIWLTRGTTGFGLGAIHLK
ncbi:hypothetical protein [Microvirga rosea]|uniref:hypothetical protein n=1 Tax=Microvirga rosea TaxID=2715425 RepID=UPI001D0AAF4B|nr:hypothetical protein [Microvirga rosea]MCB8822025.1 hypothetical protein [Microvirga rosea]